MLRSPMTNPNPQCRNAAMPGFCTDVVEEKKSKKEGKESARLRTSPSEFSATFYPGSRSDHYFLDGTPR